MSLRAVEACLTGRKPRKRVKAGSVRWLAAPLPSALLCGRQCLRVQAR